MGIPWQLGTDLIEGYAKEFLVLGRQGVQEMLDVTPFLVNYVHTENELSKRWLGMLGFTIDEAAPFGANRELFHRFHQERKNV